MTPTRPADRPEHCHYDAELERRVTARHQRYCEAAGCEGCESCTAEHCGCGRHLVGAERLTCARCVGKTRTDLERIRDLCRLAPAAATERSIGSAVMVLVGPVPEHSTHAARRAWAHGGGLCLCARSNRTCPDREPMPAGPVCEKAADRDKPCSHHVCQRRLYRPTCPGLASWLEYADDERHPLWVLGTWDMLVAEHLEHTRRARVTVAGATAYLAVNLTYLGQDDGFAFDELAREVRQCREHVERVMLVAASPQQGAPCPNCRAAGRKARPLERRYTEAGADQAADARDAWVCRIKGCGLELSLDEYGKAVWVDYLGHAERLTAAQIQAQYRIPASTIRRWSATGEVRRHGYDGQRRQLYDVADVLRMRDDPEVVAVR